MPTIRHLGFDCIKIENSALSLHVTQSAGPRIISLQLNGGPNLLAELPDVTAARPDGRLFHFYGGHRLWHAPEALPRTYSPDDGPVDAAETPGGWRFTQPVEPETGIQKSMEVALDGDRARVVVRHTLANRGLWPVECAPWAITQLRPGGLAVLPQALENTGLLPNRSLTLWPYTDLTDTRAAFGNRHILLRTPMPGPWKVGFPNPRGWLAYWIEGTVFVKRAAFDPEARYYDNGCSSECYCNQRFLELETLGPVATLAPGGAVSHTETWDLYVGLQAPEDAAAADALVSLLGLDVA